MIIRIFTQHESAGFIQVQEMEARSPGPAAYHAEEDRVLLRDTETGLLGRLVVFQEQPMTPREYAEKYIGDDEEKIRFLDHYNHTFSFQDLVHVLSAMEHGSCSVSIDQLSPAAFRLVDILDLAGPVMDVMRTLDMLKPTQLRSHVSGLNQSIRDEIRLTISVTVNTSEFFMDAVAMGAPAEQGYVVNIKVHQIPVGDEIQREDPILWVHASRGDDGVSNASAPEAIKEVILRLVEGFDPIIARRGPKSIGNDSAPTWDQMPVLSILLNMCVHVKDLLMGPVVWE